MRMYKITPGPGLNPCTEKRIEDIMVWLEEAEVGDEIRIDVIDLSEQEYGALPEYMGP